MIKYQLSKVGLILAIGILLFPVLSFAQGDFGWAVASNNSHTRLTDNSTDSTSTDSVDSTDSPDIRSQVKTEQDATDNALSSYEKTKGESESKRVEALNGLGDNAVNERQKAMTGLLNILNHGKCSNIDATVKDVLTADIKAAQAVLTTQKATLDSSTTLTTSKTKVAAVYTANMTFQHLVPAIKGACAAERIIELTSSTKIASIMSTLTAAGIDTTQLSTDLKTAQTNAKAALTLYENVAANPGSNNANAKTDLSTATADMVNAKKALSSAKNDLEVALNKLETATTSSDTTKSGSNNSALSGGNGSSTTSP